ncbi:MAG TPA: SCO family protein [Polyangia bacterium]|jgi:protein SCO1/2|nr:SCO family protein [Polyangia bacterium]
MCAPASLLADQPMKARRFLGACILVGGVVTAGVWLGHRLDPTRSGIGAQSDRDACAGAHDDVTPPQLASFLAIDQSAQMLSNRDFRGFVWIVDFVFTRCRGLCPLLSARLALVRDHVKDERTRFVSFTIDPEHDTPSALAAYARRWGPNDPRWRLLRTDQATLSRVASSLDPAAAGGLDLATHSDRFFLIDRAGDVRGSFASGDRSGQQCLLESIAHLTASGS